MNEWEQWIEAYRQVWIERPVIVTFGTAYFLFELGGFFWALSQ